MMIESKKKYIHSAMVLKKHFNGDGEHDPTKNEVLGNFSFLYMPIPKTECQKNNNKLILGEVINKTFKRLEDYGMAISSTEWFALKGGVLNFESSNNYIDTHRFIIIIQLLERS